MLKAIIIDDEINSRKTLDSLLKKYCPEVEVAGIADSVKSGLEQIEKTKPDVVFLDIEMPGGSGFDLLEKAPKINFEVIFTTAYDQYAIQAIKFSALDYLLKPIDVSELKTAIQKIEKNKKQNIPNKNLDVFIKNIQFISSHNKIALPTLDGLMFVQLNQIVRCESDGNYTNFYLTTGEKIMVSKTMKEFEDLLLANNFFRVHNAHIVNLQQIKKYVKGEGGYIIMSDNSQIEVSRRRRDEFLQKLTHV